MSTPTPAEALGPVVTAIDHVGFAVRDLDEAVAFYGRAGQAMAQLPTT